jgi:Predicted membrane protein
MDLAQKNSPLFKRKIVQLFKFGIVGLSGLMIDFSITYFFKEQLHFDPYLANAIGFSFAVVNNYFINKIWTFKNKEKAIIQQFAKFLLVAVIGLALNTLCIYLLHQQLHILFYVSKFMAIVLVFVWNYTINATLTFNKN